MTGLHIKTGRLLLIIMVLTVMAYAMGLDGGFVWDDRLFFVDNDILPSWKPWDLDMIFLQPSTYWDDYIPVTSLLFTIEYNLFGTATAGYHLVSLLLYLATGVMVYRFMELAYALAARGDRMVRLEPTPWGPEGAALVVTALFMLHPAHVEAVAYITGQKDLLYGLFSVLVFYGVALHASGRVSAPRGRAWLLLVALCYYMAFLSKAMAVATAVFLPLFWFFILRPGGSGDWGWRGWRRPLGYWLLLNLPAMGWIFYSSSMILDLLVSISSMFTRLLLGIKVLGAHLSLYLLPWPLNFGYPFNETNVFDSNMLMGGVFIGVLAAAFVIRPRSMASFGGLAFLVFLLPVLQVFVRISNAVVFDRYLYLSVLGGAIVFERAFNYLAKRFTPRRSVLALMVIVMLYGGLSTAYVPRFQSDVASLRHAYKTFPGWKRPAFDYAYALIEAGRLDEAALMVDTEGTFEAPSWVRPYFRGWIMLDMGRLEEAVGYLEFASYAARDGGYKAYPDLPLGRAYMLRGDRHKAASALRRVMKQRKHIPVEYYKAKVMLEALRGGV